MLSNQSPRNILAHISLTLVGLMWVLPFLNPRHQYPLTTFDQEWWSALLGVLAMVLLAGNDFWRKPEMPRIVQLPAALIGVVVLQWGVGKIAYFDQALLYLMYLLFALMLMMLGSAIRDSIGLEKMATILAVVLLGGALFSAMLGILQHFRWHTILNSVVLNKGTSGVYGNLAQPNHFANYTALGLASLGLLFQQRKLHAGWVALLAAPLLLVLTLSGSRSSWFYLGMMTLLAWWAGRGTQALRPLLVYSLSILAGFVLMHGIVQLPFMAGPRSNLDVMHRLFADTASGHIRLYLWQEAWLMFTRSPMLGVGIGQYAWQHFQLLPELRPANITGLYNNAHNLIFQVAAETGIVGLTVLFAGLGAWLYGLRSTVISAAHWWGYALLGVLGIHSMLEYPLWYMYFLAIAAFLLGALDQTRYQLELRTTGRLSIVVILAMSMLTLFQFSSGYRQLKQVLALPAASGNAAVSGQTIHKRLMNVRGVSLLAPYAEFYISSLVDVNDNHLDDKLMLNSAVIRFIPSGQVAYRQAFLLAQAGQQEQARKVLEQAIWSYPNDEAARAQLTELAEKSPEHFSALLEFALQKEQEYVSAVHNR